MTPAPMTRYHLTNMEREMRAQTIKENIPNVLFLVMLVVMCALCFRVTTLQHEVRCLRGEMEVCPR